MATQLVWFKRDLRLDDHPALTGAIAAGPVLGLYVFEPALLTADDCDPSHVAFVIEALTELRADFEERGGRLLIRVGDPVAILDELAARPGFAALWSHQETGNLASYRRDQRVATWARHRGVRWHEPPHNGVVRRLASRDGWAREWRRRMDARPCPPPEWIPAADLLGTDPGRIPTLADLGLAASTRTGRQRGGERAAQATLASFLDHRGVNYRADMSSPLTGASGCSRLSPYLAWGSLSVRRAYHAARARAAELREAKARGTEVPATWLPSLKSFESRLSWHCHFMQKLEDEPALEHREMNRAYRGLRDDLYDAARLAAWHEGRTGYPMVDACMRCLHETGWINFRMRAMLVSFACHHLGQPWQPVARRLAPLFLDYEPGIHYSQAQMQAGVTGINTVRIYSPAKQVADQDPDGVFVKRWVPELAPLPPKFLAEPHRLRAGAQHEFGCVIGRDYPAPIVDHATAYREARERIWAVRNTAAARAEAQRVYVKHGSRKRPRDRR